MRKGKDNKITFSEDYQPMEDALKTMCIELLNCVGENKDDERKQKLAIGILKTLSYRLKQGEQDLPHPLKFIDKWQWENSPLINEVQMMALCNEIIYILDERERGIITNG